MSDESNTQNADDVGMSILLTAINSIAAGLGAAFPGNTAVELGISQITALIEAAKKLAAGAEPQPMASYDDALQEYLRQRES